MKKTIVTMRLGLAVLLLLIGVSGFGQKGTTFHDHQVKDGETLLSICNDYRILKNEVVMANPGVTNVLNSGQILKIPSKKPASSQKYKSTVPKKVPVKTAKTELEKKNDNSKKELFENSAKPLDSEEIVALQEDLGVLKKEVEEIKQTKEEIKATNELLSKMLDAMLTQEEQGLIAEAADKTDNAEEDADSSAIENSGFPLKFRTLYVSDMVNNLSGGIRTDGNYLGLIFFGINLFTENAGLWKGGEFKFYGMNTHGGTPTADLVGDFQTFSNIENGDYTFIYQLCYLQKLKKFTLLAGVNDLNVYFAGSEYGGSFLNSSFGIDPTISVNVPLSIFPKNALGAMLNYEPSDAFSIRAAIYDGDPGDLESDGYNLDWEMSEEQGALGIAELQYNFIKEDLPFGQYKLGAFYHSATFDDLVDTGKTHDGNYGIYFVADQVLIPEKSNREEGLGAFLQLGTAPGTHNFVEYYIGAGLHYAGLFKSRGDDVLGLAIAHASVNSNLVNRFQNSLLNYESALELTYKFQISDVFAVQPDLHYIINPGATQSMENSCLVFVRLEIFIQSQ